MAWPLPAAAVELTTREVALESAEVVHTVLVTGAPAISTSLVFPDTFQAHGASCGDCIHVQPGEMDAPVGSDPRPAGNWLVEKHPERRTIIVRPAVLPSVHNPVSGFKTNLVVGLDNGHVVNVVLALVDLRRGGSTGRADAVVHMRLPQEATTAGLLAAERRRLRADFDSEVEEAAAGLFLSRLLGEVRCRRISARPYRSDRTVVRVRQMCTSVGAQPTFWCLFEVQNRSASELHLDQVELVPESGARGVGDPASFRLARATLAFNESTLGVASCRLDEGTPIPSSWRLDVVPGSPDRDAVRVEKLVL